LAANYLITRRNRDLEQTFDRVIELEPEKPFLLLEKAALELPANADLTSFGAALRRLPVSMNDDKVIVSWRF
jgi:hypothetical protein